MKINLDPQQNNASKKAVKNHPELPKTVVDDIVTLLYNKSNVHKAISNYIVTLNQKRKDLISALESSPFFNKLGSVSVHTRFNIEFNESDMNDLKAFCKKHKLNIDDFIEVKIKYQPTPAFRNILLSQSDDLFIPFYEKIKCEPNKVLHVKLSL